MKKKINILFILPLLLCLMTPSFAQTRGTDSTEEGLEYLLFEEIPVVSSTGFFKTKATKAPSYSTTINLTQIDLSATRSLADLIETYVPGMVYNRHESYGDIIGVRGVALDNSAKTMVMLNGQSLSRRQQFGWANEYDLPLIGDWQKIEVINGPGAIVHGSGAINGFINLIPKNGTDNPGFIGNVEYGFEEKGVKAEAGYGMSYGENKDLYLYAGYYNADGFDVDRPWAYDTSQNVRDTSNDIPGITRGLYTYGTEEPNYKFSGYWNHDNFKFQALYMDVNSQMNSVFAQGNSGDANNEGVYVHMGTLALRPEYTFQFNDTDSLQIDVPLEFMEVYIAQTQWISATEAEMSKLGHKEKHWEVKLTGRTTRFSNQSLAFGGLYGKRDFDEDTWFKDELDGMEQGSIGGWDEMGLFVEDVIQITDPWTVSLGARFDKVKYDTFESTTYLSADWALNMPYFFDNPEDADNTSFRIATSYEIDENTVVKGSYQQGFRYPDANYYVWKSSWSEALSRGGYGPLPEINPETMDSYELNFHHRFVEAKLDLDVNAYYNTYTDTLHWHGYDQDYWAGRYTFLPKEELEYIMFTNPGHWWMGASTNAQGDFKSLGFEIAGTWQPVEMMTLKMSYGYSKPDGMDDTNRDSLQLVTADKKEWIKYPNHQLKTNVITNFLDNNLQVAVFWLYNSAYDVDNSSNTLATVYGDPRNLINLAVTYNITSQFSAKLGVKNLFESDVPNMTFWGKPYSGAVGMDHRFIYLSGKVKLG